MALAPAATLRRISPKISARARRPRPALAHPAAGCRRLQLQPACQHCFLLITAGQSGDEGALRGAPDAEGDNSRPCVARLPAMPEPQTVPVFPDRVTLRLDWTDNVAKVAAANRSSGT